MTWPDGGSYVGPWLNGLPHTRSNEKGTRIYGNGEQYVGQWRYGRRHGFRNVRGSSYHIFVKLARKNTRKFRRKDSSHRVVLYEGLFQTETSRFKPSWVDWSNQTMQNETW